MIKNHPFQNGNKRVAVLILIYFLYSNGRKLKVGNKELYEFARSIASSEAGHKDIILSEIRNFIIQFSERIKIN